MELVAALPSAKARLIRSLVRHKKTRDTERAFILEGAKPIQELLETNASAVSTVVVTETWLKKHDRQLPQGLERAGTHVYACRESIFEQLSDVSTPAGMLAVVRQPAWNQETIFQRPRLFGLYGECLQDPANVGTIIRTAAGFGLDALWLSSDSADVFSPKVVRATAGSLLALPVFYGTDLTPFTQHGCALLATEPPGHGDREDSRAIREIQHIPPRSILALGNESRGLAETTLRQALIRFHIPVSRAIESLNVAASAAIAMFYLAGLPREEQD